MDESLPMPQKVWSDVDSYFEKLLLEPDPQFDRILQESSEAGLPAIHVSASQGKLLELLVRFQRANRILEIGTLGGYSTAWLAQGMPADGQLITLEVDARYAEIARKNLSQFAYCDSIDIRVGDAVRSLQELSESGKGPFDLIFFDADKSQYCEYLDWSLQLSRPGTMIIADNIVRDGEVINRSSEDPKVMGVREFSVKISHNSHLRSTAIQTVGAKGYDGFVLIYVD